MKYGGLKERARALPRHFVAACVFVTERVKRTTRCHRRRRR